ncbi:trypsin-like peptidase domain-containing protein [Salinibacter sp.]|uniref:trypsin-like peptidase domain-containing protein n=1 Tax=Salinibacter sp. TaxID=2065818 RepID=UPI0021E8E87A|nr:trypsin-like peptidase domain-containing protein [Salinibacter sp.]
MFPWRYTLVVLGVLVGYAWGAGPASAQERTALPSRQHATVRPTADVAQASLPSVDAAALRAEDRAANDRVGPYRYGQTLKANLSPSRHGTWEQLPSGRWLWRLRIESQDAVSLSVGFSTFQLPPDATLFLHGPDAPTVHGPYTAADATEGEHWTPLVRGDELVLELETANRERATGLTVGHVVHGYRTLPTGPQTPRSKSGACNLDVACEEADPWRDQVRAVGGYTLRRGQDNLFCSGSLVNNTAQDGRPLFLTAEHCVQSPAQANSMVFYWNFQTADCRSLGSDENGTFPRDSLTVGGWDQTSSGAVLRARYGNVHQNQGISGKPDLTLVEVDDDIPDSYNLYLNGWSREDEATRESVTIHHPRGHGKRISFDDDPSSTTAYLQNGGGDTHLRIGDWDLGTTEGGSSGGPLYDADQQVVGVLSGGFAGCTGDGTDNDQPDWYGRLAAGFENGDYNNTTVADVLDPLNTGADALDGRPLSEGPDTTPPAPIRDLRVDGVNTRDRSVTLRWTATGDDGRAGTAQRYLLRYDTTRIETAADFGQARSVSAPPPPDTAGATETAVVTASDGLEAGRTYYFALVAEDDAGNRSRRTSPDREAVLVREIQVDKAGGAASPGAGSSSRTQFVLNETQEVRVALYDLLGRRVRVLLDEEIPEGFRQTVRIPTRSLSSGPYFLRFVGERFAITRKVVVVN